MCRGDIQNALTGALGDHMHKTQQILIAVAIAHAAADSGFVAAGRTREVESGHTLRGIPRIDHALQMLVWAVDGHIGQMRVPGRSDVLEGIFDGGDVCVPNHQFAPLGFVEHHRLLELRRAVLLHVRQNKRPGRLIVRSQLQMDFVCTNGIPTAIAAVRAAPVQGRLRLVQAVVHADKVVTGDIETVDGSGTTEQDIMVATLAILRLVVYRGAFDFHFADRIGPLIIGHVIEGLKQAELDKREECQILVCTAVITDGRLPYFSRFTGRDEEQQLHFHAILGSDDPGVTEAMPAFEMIQRCFNRFPTGIPNRVAVTDVEDSSVYIHRHVVIAVAGETAQSGILPKGVPPSRLRAEPEKLLLPQIIQPR